MSAREELLNELALWFFTTGRGSREFVDKILTKHAHELAEKIRAEFRGLSGPDWEDAADLIDPEVD